MAGSEMRGLCSAALRILVAAGITTAESLRASDPFPISAAAKQKHANVSISFLHAMIGAIDDCDPQEPARAEHTGIWMRLDDLRLLR